MPLKQFILFCLASVIKCLVHHLHNVEVIGYQNGMTDTLKVASNERA